MDFVRKSLSEFNFTQKYARYIKELGRRETWEEACDRVLSMHLDKYPELPKEIIDEIKYASTAEKKKRVLSSQRARQFGGSPVLKKNWRIYNCVTSYCDRTAFFSEAFWLLLCGCGVGFSVQSHHVDNLPPLLSLAEWEDLREETFIIPDTIEGWADALRVLIQSRFGFTSTRPVFDYSEIRHKGSPLSVGGKAPGAMPLEICLTKVRNLLENASGKLTSVQCFDIVMFASDAVLSGGVRRAASIALFSADDHEMANSKTGDWWKTDPQRARANISAVVTPSTSREKYDELFNATKQFGEPGFIFSESSEFVYNPCVEIGMAPVLITDEFGDVVSEYTIDMLEDKSYYEKYGYDYTSGWQACNLVEVNCDKFTDKENALDAVYCATILATIQAGYTDSDYLSGASKKILEREALIGVSLTGMANCPKIAFDADWQAEAADLVNKTNARIARAIGINPATRTTCVKPSGNAAVLLGCTSGVHSEYAERYIRNVQVSADNPVATFFKSVMPDAVKKSVWSAPGADDVVISFPVLNDKEGTIYRKDLTAVEFIELVRLTQNNWVKGGKAREGVEGLGHNVSNTILVQEDEWDNVKDKLWECKQDLTGVSLLASYGDYVYDQPPFLEVCEPSTLEDDDEFKDKKIAAYNRWTNLRASWNAPKYEELRELEDSTTLLQEVSCAGGSCEFKV